MEPINWFMNVVTQHYFDFNGRARRAEFWWYMLVYVIGDVVLYVLGSIIHLGSGLTSLYGLALFLPTLGVSVRRLHDTNRTGWLVLIAAVPIVISWILGILALMMGMLFGALFLVSALNFLALIAAIVLIVFYAQPGTVGDNQYGSDPKAGLAAAPA
jgi:uncharacterized membrane protein YhaH (DUF805 family)